MKLHRLLMAIILGLGLTLAWLGALPRVSGPALAQGVVAPMAPLLDRPDDPVVITGGLLSTLTGLPVGQIFAYAHNGSTLTQIPFQIDERTGGGMFVPAEDGLLDGNDELVFMAADGGAWVDNPSVDAGGSPLPPSYVITVTDPISNTQAWVYLFASSALTDAVTADYVTYTSATDRIASAGRYVLGFDPIRGVRDYLTLGSTNEDVLDRDKLRVAGTVTIIFPIPFSASENNITQNSVHALDGPVRVTRVASTTLSVLTAQFSATVTNFAYRSLYVQPLSIQHSDPVQVNLARFSTDLNAQATGATYYDANTPSGVSINGSPDSVAPTPPSRWNQASILSGTVINVFNIPAGLGGTQTTFYRDDSAPESNDTGEPGSYGDAGFQVTSPNVGTYTLIRHTYFLTGTVPNVGATYLNRYDNPVQVTIGTLQNRRLYLPLVMR